MQDHARGRNDGNGRLSFSEEAEEKATDLEIQYYDIFQYLVYPWFMPVRFLVHSAIVKADSFLSLAGKVKKLSY